VQHEVEELLELEPLEGEEPMEDATVLLPADPPAQPHVVAPALVNDATSPERPSDTSPERLSDAPLERLSDTSPERLSDAPLERLSDAPSFRQPLGGKLWLVALMAAALAVLLLWSTR
jgi:hypothetical protein